MNKRDRMIACEMIRQDFVKTGKYRNWRNHSQELQCETALDVKELFDSRLPKVINKVICQIVFKTSSCDIYIYFFSQKLLSQLSLSPALWRKEHFDRNSSHSVCGNELWWFTKMFKCLIMNSSVETDNVSPTCSQSQSHFGYCSSQDSRSRWARGLEQMLIICGAAL